MATQQQSDKPTLDRLSAQLPGWVGDYHVPGISIALIEDGEVASTYSAGVKNQMTGEPVTPCTVFEAASLTKPVFTCAALQLFESGTLDLDAPLTEYLPERYIDDPQLTEITARRVLCHTTGFPNWRGDDTLRTHFPPGERFGYSGEGYVYLQKVVEHLTGQPAEAYVRSTVLGPLGMTDSSMVWTDAYETQAATGHDPEGKPVDKDKPREANAAYTLHTTPGDFAKVAAAMLARPDSVHPALQAGTINDMLRPHIAVNGVAPWNDNWPGPLTQRSETVFWGLGWGLQCDARGDSFWHWGDNGAFQAFVMAARNTRSGFVAMANSKSGRSLWQPIARAVFGAEQPAITWLLGLYEQG